MLKIITKNVCFFLFLFFVLPIQALSADFIINEIMPDPEGKDSENEWIELYNPNNLEVDLTGWQIRDKIGRARTFLFNTRTFTRTKIEPFNFVLCPIDKTKISLNNTGDIVELLSPTGQIVGKVEYPSAKQGQSYSRFAENWQWAQPSPEKPNILPQPTTEGQTKKLNNSNPTPIERQGLPETTFTNIQQTNKQVSNQKTNNILLFFISLLIAGLSTTIAVFLFRKSERV